MTPTSSKRQPNKGKPNRAGKYLLGAVRYLLTHPDVSKDEVIEICRRARELASQDLKDSQTEDEKRSGHAVIQAAEALEKRENGFDPAAFQDVFDGFVEAVHGGPRNVNLGGRRITGKLSAKECFLRAAAVVLWGKFREERDSLAAEARQILGITSKEKLRRIVDNHDQRHKDDKRPSPLSEHISSVEELVEAGWHKLSDFA
ncbi:hypothetical protein [Leisingera sp. JC11]|uniref:hypothetical protein n=1 Tax=Leisingera sp. JC11 TaxID=3042469 RepID=UPI0034530966